MVVLVVNYSLVERVRARIGDIDYSSLDIVGHFIN